MSSWAQQRESIRRAVEAGASARTSGQGSELLRRPGGQQLLLSRPNGQPTRAGQFYYQLAGRRAPSRRFNENQQLVREGPNDYIYLRGGAKKLVHSLQPDGEYRVTKLGRSGPITWHTCRSGSVGGAGAARPTSGRPSCPWRWTAWGARTTRWAKCRRTATSSPPLCARWATPRTAPPSWSSRRRPIPTTPRGTGPSPSRRCRWWTIGSRPRWRSTGAWACCGTCPTSSSGAPKFWRAPSSRGRIGSAWCASCRSCFACPTRRSTRTSTRSAPRTGSGRGSPGPRSGSSASGARRRCTSSTAAGRCSTATSRPSGSSGPWPAASTRSRLLLPQRRRRGFL